MTRAKTWLAMAAALLAAGWVNAAEPAVTRTDWPLWDGKESVADYAKRAGIKDVQKELDLGAGISMKLILIPAGKFMMGSPESERNRDSVETRHEVTISKPFYMGIYEVTQEQYERVVGSNSSEFKGKTLPVERIDWNEAAKFCEKLSTNTGMKVSLPTEAQWEYACRAGTTTPFNTGETISADQANYYATYTYGNGVKGEYRQKTTPVGTFKPNDFGLYDMHGNVWEWTSDYFGPYDAKANNVDPQNAPTPWRVLRGGSWGHYPVSCRSAKRYWFEAVYRNSLIGFRVAVLPASD